MSHGFRVLSSLLLMSAVGPALQAGLTTYPDPTNAVVSSVFSLTIDGTPVTVMDYMDYHYAHFAFDGTISVTVTAPQNISTHRISPLSLGIQGQVNAGTNLTFSVTQAPNTDSTPPYLVVQINALEKLVILGDPPETNVPASSGAGIFNVVTQYGADPTGAAYTQPAIQNAINAASSSGTPSKPGIVYVPAGIYKVRADLLLKNNVDFYLAPGAVLKADTNVNNYTVSSGTIEPVLVVDDAANVTIRGRGEVDASGITLMDLLSQRPPIFLEQSASHPRRRIIRSNNNGSSSNVEINGILAKDATGWSVESVKTSGVVIKNVKVLNHKDINWKIQNDGINITSSSDALVNQCFVMTIDDAMCSKARYASVGSMNNVDFANNVLWNWSAGVKCGMQNDHPMNNVVFRNIDIVHCRRAIALDTKTSQAIGQTIPIENVAFRDIRVEEMEGNWSISNHDAVEFLLEDAPVNNIGITNFTLPENRPLRCGPAYPASNVNFHNLVMAGQLITNVSQVTLAGTQPISNLTFTAGDLGPGVNLSGPASHANTSFVVTATFTENVTGLTAGDFVVTNGTASGLAGGPAIYTANITPLAPGTVTVSLPGGVAQDNELNDNRPSNLLLVSGTVPGGGGFQESGGVLSMEGESGTIGSRWNTGSDAGASGGAYIEVNPAYSVTGSAPQCETADCLVTYDFTISTPGNYRFWFRLFSTNGNDDSFFWRINGGSWITENNRYDTVPQWFSTDNTQVDSLGVGSHELEIAYRENGTRLDKFVIQLDSAPAPSGDGPPESGQGTPDTTPPAAPTGLVATAGAGSVSLDWADNTEPDLAGYSVYRSTLSGSYGAALATGVVTSAYMDNTALNGTTYYYVVTAVDDSSNASGDSNEADSDELPDSWEMAQFGNLTTSRGGTDNFDGDPHTDEMEWIAGTDATNAASFFRILSGDMNAGTLEVSFDAIAGRLYALEIKAGLLDTNGWTGVDSLGSLMTNGVQILQYTPPSNAAASFGRVSVSLPGGP